MTGPTTRTTAPATPQHDPHVVKGEAPGLPYRIACLCDLRDEQGRILLLRRLKAPNQGLCSPIGGKLHVAEGESPAGCAQREILEEAGLHVEMDRLHLIGLVSECAFEGKGHWLMFVYRVIGPVQVEPRDMREGRLDWFRPEELEALPLPETDRKIIWPLLRRAEPKTTDGIPGFFAVHIDCRGDDLAWRVEQESPPR
jgi:8-oxo-dGTP diphosphatase